MAAFPRDRAVDEPVQRTRARDVQIHRERMRAIRQLLIEWWQVVPIEVDASDLDLLDMDHERVAVATIPNGFMLTRHGPENGDPESSQYQGNHRSLIPAKKQGEEDTGNEEDSAGGPVVVAYPIEQLCATLQPRDPVLQAYQCFGVVDSG